MTRDRDNRRKTPPRGFPVYIDPEATPPPTEIPHSLRAYETLPPQIADHLRQHASKLDELTQAIGRVWDARDANEEISTIKGQLSEITGLIQESARHGAKLEQLMPMVRALTAHVDSLDRIVVKLGARSDQHWTHDWPRMIRQMDELDKRVDKVDDIGTDLTHRITAANDRSERVTQENQKLKTEEANVLKVILDRLHKLETEKDKKEAVSKALAKQERKKSVVASGATGAVVAIVAKLLERFT